MQYDFKAKDRLVVSQGTASYTHSDIWIEARLVEDDEPCSDVQISMIDVRGGGNLRLEEEQMRD